MPFSAFGQPKELLIGIEPEHNIFDQMKRHRSLAAHLSDQLGIKVKLTIMSRYGEVIKRFKTLKLDGAFLTSYTAILGINQLNLEPVVNPVNLSGESTSQGYIFIRRDNAIRNVLDLEGSSIVFVDPASMAGYLFPLVFFQEHGVKNINKFFNRYYFSGSHESTIYAVLDGRADIGAARDTVFNNLVSNDLSIEQDLKIIARSPKVPEITLCIKSDIDQKLKNKLSNILLLMDRTDDGRKVLQQFKAKRFVKSNKEDFIIIDDMAQKALGTLTVQGN
jgi:phosphonate transport system substrate-binding protein